MAEASSQSEFPGLKSRCRRGGIRPRAARKGLTALGWGNRGEGGLTTLEWLLVVAAVAGLAALAVVLVQNVVDRNAESLVSHSARQEAASLATVELADRWQAETPNTPDEADEINREYSQKCRTIGIIYSDIDLTARPLKGIFDLTDPGWGPPQNLPVCSLV